MIQFGDLPLELKCKIFSHVEPYEFAEVCRVCKDWNRAVNDTATWVCRLEENNIYCGPDVLHFILFDRKEMMGFYLLQRKKNLLKNINLSDNIPDDLDLSESENS